MAQRSALYFRNFVFGVEDSLVSTVGLLTGVAIGGVSRETILLTGIVLILVEAFSMASGSFLAESSSQEYLDTQSGSQTPFWGSIVMFVSYFAAGFIPLAPYIFLDPSQSLIVSVGLSLAALFILGVVGASLSRVSLLRRGMRMALVGGIAIIAGVVAGYFLAV